jgi:hypothetical protein
MKLKKIHSNSATYIFIKKNWVVIIGAILFFNQVLFSDNFHVISDPTPTVKEDKVVYLEEVLTVNEDLGNDQYLFYPFSIAADKSNVFVYDKSQARVYRFSPQMELLSYFGRKGPGPGEFSTTGKTDYIGISLGRDGNIYANDLRVRKIKGFDREGKNLKTFFYGDNFFVDKPVGDKHGNILYVTMKNGNIKVKNEMKITMAQSKIEKVHRSFFFEKPSKYYRESYDLQSFAPEATWRLTIDSKLLIFFKASSTMTIFNENKFAKTLKLWPKEALQDYKKKLHKLMNKHKNAYTLMFSRLIIDQDNKDIFYLQYSSNKRKQKIAATLYAFNLEGKLLKVIHVPTNPEKEDPGSARINAKVNKIFYAIRDREEVVLFKEKK